MASYPRDNHVREFAFVAIGVGLIALTFACGPGNSNGSGGTAGVAGAQEIGPAGGTVNVVGGPLNGASITIPPGVLTTTVSISITPGTPFSYPGYTVTGGADVLGPDGLFLGAPASVTIPYDPSLFPPGTGPSGLVILYKDPTGTIIKITPTSVDTTDHLVTFSVTYLGTAEPAVPTPSGGTPTPTPSGSGTPTPSGSKTPTPSGSGSGTPTPSGSGSPTPTPTPTGTSTPTPTPTGTSTSTPTPTPTSTATSTPTPTSTATSTPTPTSTATTTPTATATATGKPTSTATPSSTATASPTSTGTATASPTATGTATGTATATAVAS